jgi:uncharacterized protein YjeT (DUF2065 family)
MSESIWLAVCSVLVSVIGGMFILGYRDLSVRFHKLERQDAKLNAAVLTLLIAKADDTDAIAHALHGLLTNGIEVTST